MKHDSAQETPVEAQHADTGCMTIKLIRCRACLAEWFDKEPDRWGNLWDGIPTCQCGQRGSTPEWVEAGEQFDGEADAR